MQSDPDSLLLGVACGLAASVAWALANLLIDHTGRLDGPVRPVLGGQLAGACLLLLVVPLAPPTGLALPWGWMVLGGAASLAGYVAMFQAFAAAPMAIVSPLVASWALVSAALGVALFGEALPPQRALGALLVVGGVVGLAAGRGGDAGRWARSRAYGVGSSLLSALGFGLMVAASRPIEAALGTPLTVVVLWAVQWVALLPWVLLRHGPHLLPPPGIRGAVLAFGLIEALGFVAVVAGGAVAPLSVVAPTASLGALLTVGLAWWRRGERVRPAQVALATAVVGGIALLGQ